MIGTNLINGSPDTLLQLQEASRISDRVFALIDSERGADENEIAKSRLDFQTVCSKAQITCHILKRRSIENYLTDRAVKAAFGPEHRGLAPFEPRTALRFPWSKRENWKAAQEMTKEELNETDLGEFLQLL